MSQFVHPLPAGLPKATKSYDLVSKLHIPVNMYYIIPYGWSSGDSLLVVTIIVKLIKSVHVDLSTRTD